MGGAVLCHWPYTFYSGALLGLERQDLVNLISLLSATVRASLSIILLLWVSQTVAAFLISSLVAGLFQVFLSAAMLWWVMPGGFWKGRFTPTLLKKVGKRGLQLSAVAALAILILNIDKALLGHFLNLTELGYYCFSWAFFTGILNLASIPLMVFGPKFSHLIALGDKEELAATYHQASQWMSTLIIPVAAVLLYFLKDILLLWTGDEGLAAQTCLPASLLILGAGFVAVLLPPPELPAGQPLGRIDTDHAGLRAHSPSPSSDLRRFPCRPYRRRARLAPALSSVPGDLLEPDAPPPACQREAEVVDPGSYFTCLGALLVCGLARLFISSPVRGPAGIGILLAIWLLAVCASALAQQRAPRQSENWNASTCEIKS